MKSRKPMLCASVMACCSIACTSAHRSLSVSSFHQSRPSLGWKLDSLSIRGGALAIDDSDYDVSESEMEYDSDEAEEEDELSENEMSNLEDDSEDEEEESTPSTSASGPPVKLSITTALQSALVDQHLEFMASRKRTVESLKQAVSKTMRGRPPLSCITLKYHGRSLDDDETIDDLLQDMDDEDESDDENDLGEDEDTIKLSLTCDAIPPIDAKFAIEFREKIMKKSAKEILEAYCLNMAGMAYSQELQAGECESFESTGVEDEDDEEEEHDHSHSINMENHSMNIRKKAAFIQKQFESTLSAEILELMDEEYERVKSVSSEDGDAGNVLGLVPQGNNSPVRSGRKGRSLKGGATMNVKRALQRNLNVNWADTTRNSLLFLFFGYFGGRNSFSRTFLLLMSPLCFFIQTRPIKVAMKVLFYAMGEPPSIFLSLLPAPQQAIMSLNYGAVMKGLYGEKALEGEEWLEMKLLEESGDYDDDQDELDIGFDDEYDDESEYDSDDDY